MTRVDLRTAALEGSTYARRAGLRIRRSWLRWNAREHGAVVLCYHRVFDADSDPQLLCVSPQLFEEHMRVVRDRWHPIRVSELTSRLRKGHSVRDCVCVTFDDGYTDNFVNAKPLLEGLAVPATVYVTTGYAMRRQEFFWDELERLILTGQDARQEYRRLLKVLQRSPQPTRERVLGSLRSKAAGDHGRQQRPSDLPMTPGQVKSLADGGLVEIGAHGHDHLMLARHPERIQHREITMSKRLLEEWLGREVTSFSYPFGTPGIDFTRRSRRLTVNAGFESVVTSFQTGIRSGASPTNLPRLVVRQWSPTRFVEEVEKMMRPGR